MPENRVSIGVGLGVGLFSIAGIGYLWNLWRTEKPPTKWRKVGELCDLLCFPIKSAGAIRMDEMDCSMIGVQAGYLRDRVFMCVTLERNFLTARTHPKLVLIQPRVEGSSMILSAPEMPEITIYIEQLLDLPRVQTSVWGQLVQSIDCGDEVSAWFSQYLLGEEAGIRLVYYPSNRCDRDTYKKNVMFQTVDRKDYGALHDETSYHLINESSISDLNSRVKQPVTPQQYRPNFVVRGAIAFEEDNWRWVRIGTATFRNVLPCTRCILTGINPTTGRKDYEALNVLRKYRQFPKTGRDPVLGIHLGARTEGRIKIGDAVYVEAN